MPDDKTKAGPADRERVNVNEEWEVAHWCRMFVCTPEQLKAAVGKVGPMVKDVRKELGR